MQNRRPRPAPARASAAEVVAVGLACCAAPVLLALPLLGSFDVESWPLILGLALVMTGIAAALLIGTTPTQDRDELEVGFIWIFAGASSALAFTGPGDSCLSTSPQLDVGLGALAGALAWPCFVVLRRMLDHWFQRDAS